MANPESAGSVKPKTTLPSLAEQSWLDRLKAAGFDTATINELHKIWVSANGNANLATPNALAYIRSTPWYAEHYPGISQGINAGLFNDERGYNAYKNQVTQLYKQYYNRAPTASEVGGYVSKGQSVSQISSQLQSRASQSTLSDPLRALFSPNELKAFTDEQAGIDTALGQRISQEANLAAGVSQLYQDFRGSPITRAELNQLLKAGATPQSVGEQFKEASFTNAINPAISALFTPDEIQQAATDAAGGVTPNGAKIKALMDLTAQLNPVYHQYTGNGVSRQEVEAAFAQGQTAQQIQAHLAGAAYVGANQGDIQQALGSYGGAEATPTELQALGENAVGYDSALGQRLQTSFEKAQRRLTASFQGTVGRASVTLNNGRLTGPAKTPDIAA